MGERRRGRSGETLLIASTGGHLEQLSRLRQRFTPESAGVRWVTFDDPQARSLLAGENVEYIRYVAPRDYVAVAANLRAARRILREHDIARVVSTGSGIALSFLPTARLAGIPCHYVESAARADGPSLTGRIASRVPGVALYSQYPSWAAGRWQYRGSLFDGYDAEPPLPGSPVPPLRRVVVTLGTMRTYGFRRALTAVARVLPEVLAPDAEVLWQTGATDASGLDVDARKAVPASELHEAMATADLVIAHAGIGSALTALDLGRCPVLLPRRRHHGEHVDDHQLMIADELARRGLAVSRDPADLAAADLVRAMTTPVKADETARPFELSAPAGSGRRLAGRR